MHTRFNLLRALKAWGVWCHKNHHQLIPRHVHLKIKLPSKNALAFVGVRRGGKTFSALQLIPEKYLSHTCYFNFEDPLFIEDNGVDNLDELLSVFTEQTGYSPKLVIFDEIYNVNGWERWVRKTVDINPFPLIITGSSSKLLSSEISTSIAGRCLEKKIWPLSFADFLQFAKRHPASSNEYLGALRHYFQYGGFPEITLLSSEQDKKELLAQYLRDIVFKDVIQRNEIRSTRALNQLVLYYFTNLSSHHSYTSLKKAFGISLDTSAEYTHYLAEAFLLFEVSRYHPNLKIQSRDTKKIYVIDTGLRNIHALSKQDDRGKLAENVVFLELKRRGHEVYYYKSQEKGEVDFLITNLGQPQEAIQVCYSNLNDVSTFDREVHSLVACLQETSLGHGTILTLDREETMTVHKKRIRFVPLYHWLLHS